MNQTTQPPVLPSEPDHEGRGEPRLPWHGSATLHVGAHSVGCGTTDLSEGGIGLTGNWLAQCGQLVQVRFEIEGYEVHAVGTVIWRRRLDGGAAWGVQFTAVSPEDNERIRAFVHQGLPEPVEVDRTELRDLTRPGFLPTSSANPPTGEMPVQHGDPMADGLDDFGFDAVGEPLDAAESSETLPGDHSPLWDDDVGDVKVGDVKARPAPRRAAARVEGQPRLRHRVTTVELWRAQQMLKRKP